MTAVNLIPAYRLAARRRRTRTGWWTGVCVVYGLGLAIAYTLLAANLEGQTDAVTGQTQRLTEQIQLSRQAIADTRVKLESAKAHLRANLAVGRQPDFSVLLAVLAAHLDENVALSECRLTPRSPETNAEARIAERQVTAAKQSPDVHGPIGRYTVNVDGLANSQSAASEYVLRLEQTQLFQRVVLLETTRQRGHGRQAVGFRLECLLGQ
jgi:hypothetical protein